jgi:hypothetical protein
MIYDLNHTTPILNWMDDEEKRIFAIDVTSINWRTFVKIYFYGLKKFILKQDVEEIESSNENIVERSVRKYDTFMDIMWVYKRKDQTVSVRTITEVKAVILDSAKVKEQIEIMVAEQGGSVKARRTVMKESEAIMNRICAKLSMKMLKTVAYFITKAWRSMYD